LLFVHCPRGVRIFPISPFCVHHPYILRIFPPPSCLPLPAWPSPLLCCCWRCLALGGSGALGISNRKRDGKLCRSCEHRGGGCMEERRSTAEKRNKTWRRGTRGTQAIARGSTRIKVKNAK
jgi:hypothetical protein